MYAQLDEPLAPEVLAALVELTALTRRANQAGDASMQSVANDLLTYLLHLCRAERGAILLPEDQLPFERSVYPLAAMAAESEFRIMALHEMREEDVAALLAGAAGATDRPTRGICWRAYRLYLDEEQAQAVSRRLERLPQGSADGTGRAETALLVIGWPDPTGQEQAPAALVARCSTLLPPITGAVEGVISALLLRERMNELERNSMREALEGMEMLKAELLGTVSHELRSPLASIKGYAATLLRQEHRLAREERHQFLLAITEASDRLEAIIERLLEISQLETDQITLRRSPVDVVHLATEAIAARQERVEASKPGLFVFRLQLENAAGMPARTVPLILADPRRLHEVLDNLLENAVTYSPGGGLITVTVRQRIQDRLAAKGAVTARASRDGKRGQGATPAPRTMLEICVSDQGQGIPAAHLDRIFERFHRVDTRLTRETGGLGLGLTICKRIVELHGGSIWAENRPQERGSAFYVLLPIEEEKQLQSEERNEGSTEYVYQENNHPDR